MKFSRSVGKAITLVFASTRIVPVKMKDGTVEARMQTRTCNLGHNKAKAKGSGKSARRAEKAKRKAEREDIYRKATRIVFDEVAPYPERTIGKLPKLAAPYGEQS